MATEEFEEYVDKEYGKGHLDFLISGNELAKIIDLGNEFAKRIERKAYDRGQEHRAKRRHTFVSIIKWNEV